MWSRSIHFLGGIALALAFWAAPSHAQTRPRVLTVTPRATEPDPLQDDATLNCVTFVGPRFGCAVGDRGACWMTRDGGATWSFSATPVNCALKSVQFLTDKVGWAVGGEVAPYTRFATGVVIQTTDGGHTWQVLSQKEIPPLSQVHFIDGETALAIGEASPRCPSGVFTTTDGGKTWTPSQGPRVPGWTAGAILPTGNGVVAGPRGELGILDHGSLLRKVETLKGLRAIHAVTLGPDSSGWLVGDGGLIQTTKNNGISWGPPTSELPMELRECMDFHAVAQVGEHVWITGSPGSVVWHSADAGATWSRQLTHETTPLRSLHFVDELRGVAVGDLGKILITQDGGETWTAARGGGRHLAILAIHAHPPQVPLGALAYFSQEWGYRSAVLLMTRRDVGTDALAHLSTDGQLQEAVSVVGGSQASVDWRLPITVPGLDRNREKLVEEWLLLTDQKLPQVMTTDLAAKIRMWQPEVIMISQPQGDDAATQVVWDSVQEAVRLAATTARTGDLEPLVDLAPWQVKKIFSHAAGEKGTQNISSNQALDRTRLTVDQLAEPAAARMLPRDQSAIRDEGLTLVSSILGESDAVKMTVFGGLNTPAGGSIRRKLAPIVIEGLDRQQLAIEKRQKFRNYSVKLMDSRPQQSSSLLAQLRDLVAEMPPEQGAKLLSDIARDYRERMLWEPAEEAHTLILDLYPDHPAATDSALWLLNFWTSEEIAWQRLRTRQSRQIESQTDTGILQAQFQSQLQTNRKDPTRLSNPEFDAPATPPIQQTKSSVPVVPGDLAALASGQTRGEDVTALQAEQWRQRAAKIAGLMQQTSPGFFQEPKVQLTVAALMRRSSRPTDGDRVLDQLLKLDAQDAWNQIAMGELWLLRPQAQSPRPVATCRRTSLAPRLDGQLTDACWQGAAEIVLTERPQVPDPDGFVGTTGVKGGHVQIVGPKSVVKLMYDDRFLYLAASLPRVDGQSLDPPQHGGRTHDADLELHDHLSFQFDTDRDYSTYYTLGVDQRGWTTDSCLEASRWNPKWYVAAWGDEQVWRFEAAIPWEELAQQPPQAGTCWATGITRILPSVGLQGWSHPLSETTAPESFGLMRFE